MGGCRGSWPLRGYAAVDRARPQAGQMMMNTALMVWHTVAGLGTGGKLVAYLVLANILLLVAFLVIAVVVAIRRRGQTTPTPTAKDAAALEDWQRRYRAYAEDIN